MEGTSLGSSYPLGTLRNRSAGGGQGPLEEVEIPLMEDGGRIRKCNLYCCCDHVDFPLAGVA